MSGLVGIGFLHLALGGEVGAQRPVRGPSPNTQRRKGPLTRPKRVDLSPEGRGEP
ncbi:hypothetical protein ABIB57_001892 [Devosia sp. UYZn731]